MDYLIKLSFVLVLFTMTWLYQEQNQEWDVERSLLKSANDFAAHDAVQLVRRDSVGEGHLLLDDAAYDAFLAALRANLGLDASLHPLPGSRLPRDVTVVWFQIIDERTVTFPHLYENATYHIAKYLRGPAVIAVIETPHPILFRRLFEQQAIRVPAIQEYATVA
jgi:hypothetical protein